MKKKKNNSFQKMVFNTFLMIEEKYMKERLAKLINVKSIISILMTIVFCYLAITGAIGSQLFITIFTTVIAFYFGTQLNKQEH